MKNKCSNCGQIFNGQQLEIRDDGNYEEYWGSKVWMPSIVSICPYCKSEDIDEYDENEEENE